MIEINEELRDLYYQSSVSKQLYIVFPGITLTNEQIFDFSIEENLSSDTDIVFGTCNASVFKARVEGVSKEMVGQKCSIYHIVDSTYNMPLGTYVIDGVSKKDDLGYREITGYDEIYTKLAADVTDWYKALALPMPLKTFRQSLFAYVGITVAEQELINDEMIVERTIEPATLNGRTVAQAIGEINGTFGHIGRDGKFKYVSLGNTGLYPAEDLYPSEDLYPAEADSKFESSVTFSCTREEYEVSPIDCLQIRQEEGDVGTVVFDTRNYTNPYIVTGNFLVYGKSASQLAEISRTLFDHIKGIPYTPYEARTVGLPYMEVGDGVTFVQKADNFLSFVLKRKLSGIQSLRDEISATGSQYRNNEVSPNDEIEMLKGRSMSIQKSVDGLKIEISDLEADTIARFDATAASIKAQVSSLDESLSGKIELTKQSLTTEINNTAEGLNSKIEQTASSIAARVNGLEGAYAALEIDLEDIVLAISDMDGNLTKLQIDIEGFTFTSGGGTVKIKGDCIETGTLKSISVVFNTHNAVYWVAGGSSLTDTAGADWICDSNAIWTGNQKLHLYTSGNIHTLGKMYFGDDLEGLSDYYYNSSWHGLEANGFKAESLWCDYGYSDSWDSSSDERLKDNIRDFLDDEIEYMTDNLRPVCYRFRRDKKRRFGFVAQEILAALNDLYGEDMPFIGKSPEGMYTISYDDFIAVMWRQLQILKEEIRSVNNGSGN